MNEVENYVPGVRSTLDGHIRQFGILLSKALDDKVRGVAIEVLEDTYMLAEAIMRTTRLSEDDERYLMEKRGEIRRLGGFRK